MRRRPASHSPTTSTRTWATTTVCPTSVPASAAGSADGKREKIRRFHELLAEGYEKAYPENPGIITAKLKELWFYLGDSFPGTEREQKALKKAKTPEELIAAASRILGG